MEARTDPSVPTAVAQSAQGPCLPAVKLVEFAIRWRSAGRIPEFRGSAVRGAFGRGLRATGCARGGGCGGACQAPEQCPVAHLFETPPLPAGSVPTRFRQPPHPAVLRVAGPGTETVEAGTEERFGWAVLEPAWGWLPAIERAVGWMAEAGLGAERVRFGVEGARTTEAAPRAITGNAVTLRLETPLRLQSEGQPWRQWETGEFVRAVVRRVWLLAEFYGGERRHPPAPADWAVRAERVAVRWEDRQRYSSRQGREVPWGGLLGEVELTGVPAELGALLGWAEVVGVGKGTSMGLGRVGVGNMDRLTARGPYER